MYQNVRKLEDLVIFTHEDLLTKFGRQGYWDDQVFWMKE